MADQKPEPQPHRPRAQPLAADQEIESRRQARRPSRHQAELPGDPVCLLRRVCQNCGSVADEDPPTSCPTCHSELT
jgi:hypothetical protein